MDIINLRKKMWFWGFLLLMGFGLLLGSACKKQSAKEEMASRMMEKAIKDQTGQEAKVDIQEGRVSIQTQEGSGEIRQTRQWSPDIPGDVPPFTMGKIKGVTVGEREGQKSWNIVLEEVKTGAQSAYLETLKSKGWKITSTVTVGNGGTITAQKGKLNVVAMFQGDENSGMITVVQK